MKSFLKNYTSEVPVSQTIYRIEQTLLRCGVTGIAKEYDAHQNVLAITFRIDFEGGSPVTVRLPADVKKAQEALWEDYISDADKSFLNKEGTEFWGGPRKKSKADFKLQGERTAWKIIQDWVEVQMSMIQMKQAEVREVFLPYVWDERRKQTFFSLLKNNGFRAMLPEKADEAK